MGTQAVRVSVLASPKVKDFLSQEQARIVSQHFVELMVQKGKPGQYSKGFGFSIGKQEVAVSVDYHLSGMLTVYIMLPEEAKDFNNENNIATDKGELQDIAAEAEYDWQTRRLPGDGQHRTSTRF